MEFYGYEGLLFNFVPRTWPVNLMPTQSSNGAIYCHLSPGARRALQGPSRAVRRRRGTSRHTVANVHITTNELVVARSENEEICRDHIPSITSKASILLHFRPVCTLKKLKHISLWICLPRPRHGERIEKTYKDIVHSQWVAQVWKYLVALKWNQKTLLICQYSDLAVLRGSIYCKLN